MAGEFDLIADYFNWPSGNSVPVGVGDDAAVLAVTPQHELVVSVDTLVAGVHFPLDAHPIDVGYKSLIVNLSDIAAMGAEPKWFTLALTLPDADRDWLSGFSSGLKQAASEYGVALVGGDTTRGACTISIQIMGEVAAGSALKRSAAKLGDALYMTNCTGDAAAGLAIHQASGRPLSQAQTHCLSRLNRPTARIAESRLIRQYANACMDISDGLLQDLSHILKASELGAIVKVSTLQVSNELAQLYPRPEALHLALGGGDDYELLLTIPQAARGFFEDAMQSAGFAYQMIGEMTSEVGVIYDDRGKRLSADGFRHF